MPITITSFPTQPAVNLNQVHLRELKITLSDENVSKATVRISYSLFGRDAEDNKHLDKQIYTVQIEDAFVQAGIDAANGDPSLATALVSIESAIASILNARGAHGTVTRT